VNKQSDFRRISEAAEHLGVSPNPLRNGQNAGKPSVHRHPVYVRPFDDVCMGAGRTKKKPPIKSPNLQAFVERVSQTLKHEALNGFCVVSEQHQDSIHRAAADRRNRQRAIQAGITSRRCGTRIIRRSWIWRSTNSSAIPSSAGT